jgi:hypothetical protein
VSVEIYYYSYSLSFFYVLSESNGQFYFHDGDRRIPINPLPGNGTDSDQLTGIIIFIFYYRMSSKATKGLPFYGLQYSGDKVLLRNMSCVSTIIFSFCLVFYLQ